MAMENNGTLASTINKPVDPFAMAGQISRGATAQERGSAARSVREQFLRSASEASQAEQTEKARLKQAQIDKELEQERGFVSGMETAQQKLQTDMGQMPERRVSEFDPNAGLELAAMTALFGAFAGSLSGRAGLRAMEGVSRGYKEGRDDLYNRELKAYEDELVRYKDRVERAKMVYENALKMETAKRGMGAIELKKLDPELQNTYIAAKGKAQGFVELGKAIDAADKLGTEAEIKLLQATQGKNIQGGEPSKEERDRIVMRSSLQSRIPELIQIVEKNKDKLGLKTLLNEQLLSRLDTGGTELRSSLAQIDADYRFSKGGKALTKNENEILKGVSDWRGKNAESILRQLNALKNYVDTDQSIYQRLYPSYMSRLSETEIQPGVRKKFATAEDADMAFSQGRIKDGEKIVIGNRNATYRAD